MYKFKWSSVSENKLYWIESISGSVNVVSTLGSGTSQQLNGGDGWTQRVHLYNDVLYMAIG